MFRIYWGCARVVRRSPNLFLFAGGLLLAVGAPCWFDWFMTRLWYAKASVSNGNPAPPAIAPLVGLYDPVAKSGLTTAVMVTIISSCIGTMVLALLRVLRPREIPP